MLDKDKAIEVYAAQALNIEAERQACEIRLRAERRAGQLLRLREKAKGAAEPGTNRGATPCHDVSASPLADLGISHDQSSNWQKPAVRQVFDRARSEAFHRRDHRSTRRPGAQPG
jgi:hypothetical protein